MRKNILRLIHQKRFKLMNRWNSRAAFLQPRFGAVADPVFRSFIFHAFEELAGVLRDQGKNGFRERPSLLEKIAFPIVPDLDSYRHAFEIGGEVVNEFLREDPGCLKRFSPELLEEARESVDSAVATLVATELEAYRKKWPPEKDAALFCIRCGRPLTEK